MPSELIQTLNRLPQAKVDELIQICEDNWEQPHLVIPALSTLYHPSDASPEAKEFRNFLTKHEISVLGGKNTKLFLVKNRITQESQVFRVNKSSHLLTKEVMKALAKDGIISPVRLQKNSQMHRGLSLSVTDFFPAGSFEKYYERKPLTNPERYQQCSENIQKMIIGFQKLQQHGVLFTDAKIPNWIIGNDKNLIISDTKSLLTVKQMRGSKGELLITPGYIPPEIRDFDQNMNIEKVHLFILGANLYEYLTGRRPPPEGLGQFHFRNPIFDGIIGQRYKALILNLTQDNPSSRKTLDEVMQKLKSINQEQVELRSTYYHTNRHHWFGTKVKPTGLQKKYDRYSGDALKSAILGDFKQQIEQISDIEALHQLKTELVNKPEYDILRKSQGWFTKDGKTSSVSAFEQMFKVQANNIENPPDWLEYK